MVESATGYEKMFLLIHGIRNRYTSPAQFTYLNNRV